MRYNVIGKTILSEKTIAVPTRKLATLVHNPAFLLNASNKKNNTMLHTYEKVSAPVGMMKNS